MSIPDSWYEPEDEHDECEPEVVEREPVPEPTDQECDDLAEKWWDGREP